jgi:hypothetical protein
VPLPQASQLFGREQEEREAMQKLAPRGQRYVELRGGAGEGKSALACHLAQLLCTRWGQQPRQKQPGGYTAHAHMVDLRGEAHCCPPRPLSQHVRTSSVCRCIDAV